jgi:hypothetical protein
MCLSYVSKDDLKIATEDIICFKVVIVLEGILHTPYRHMKVMLGETYTSDLDEPDCFSEVNKGLHAFLTLEQAKYNLKHFDMYTCHIIKCIIPIGSKYYIGEFYSYFGRTAITSNTLKYINYVS